MHNRLFWICRVHAQLLRLYPASHRQLFAVEMATVFEQALADAARYGWFSVLMFSLRELRDLPPLLLTEHRSAITERVQQHLSEQAHQMSAPPGILPVANESALAIFQLVIRLNPRLRRLFDVVFALVGILITAPIWLVVPLLIKCDSSGPIIYRQMRLGKDGRPYPMFKFRSMHVNRHLPLPPSAIKHLSFDPRLTRIGRLTRYYHVDEIPQLFNVLKGDMSIFGPRPQWPAQ